MMILCAGCGTSICSNHCRSCDPPTARYLIARTVDAALWPRAWQCRQRRDTPQLLLVVQQSLPHAALCRLARECVCAGAPAAASCQRLTHRPSTPALARTGHPGVQRPAGGRSAALADTGSQLAINGQICCAHWWACRPDGIAAGGDRSPQDRETRGESGGSRRRARLVGTPPSCGRQR